MNINAGKYLKIVVKLLCVKYQYCNSIFYKKISQMYIHIYDYKYVSIILLL